MSKGAGYEIPTVSGVNDSGKDAERDGRLVGAAWGETMKQSVAEWSRDEARVEERTKARKISKARVGDRGRLEGARRAKYRTLVEFWPTAR